ADCGLRAQNQLGSLDWGDVRWSDSRPTAIIAESRGRFKVDTPIWAPLSPDAAAALEDWRSKSRAAGTGPRNKILSSPAPGSVSPRPLDIWAIGRLLNTFERRWGLPHLTAVDFRHWVKHLCKLRGVSAESAARLQGHTPP